MFFDGVDARDVQKCAALRNKAKNVYYKGDIEELTKMRLIPCLLLFELFKFLGNKNQYGAFSKYLDYFNNLRLLTVHK